MSSSSWGCSRAAWAGIGQAVFLSKLASEYRLILVSATTGRTGIGLRAEPHVLYAALEGIIEVMNERRISHVTPA